MIIHLTHGCSIDFLVGWIPRFLPRAFNRRANSDCRPARLQAGRMRVTKTQRFERKLGTPFGGNDTSPGRKSRRAPGAGVGVAPWGHSRCAGHQVALAATPAARPALVLGRERGIPRAGQQPRWFLGMRRISRAKSLRGVWVLFSWRRWLERGIACVPLLSGSAARLVCSLRNVGDLSPCLTLCRLNIWCINRIMAFYLPPRCAPAVK